MRVAVVDGQGGGIGKAIVERIRIELGDAVQILALGTNALAASLMLKAGANEAASGENAIVFNAAQVDIIIGSVGIIAANSMLGELSPKMAEAIATSSAKKIFIPLNRCGLEVVGVSGQTLPELIGLAVNAIRAEISMGKWS